MGLRAEETSAGSCPTWKEIEEIGQLRVTCNPEPDLGPESKKRYC